MKTILEKITKHLEQNGIEFSLIHHEPTYTSESSALVRGETLKTGAKAIVMKVDDEFKLFVLSAVLKIDSKAIKSNFNAKKIRFATSEELFEQTGLVSGAVPPFGKPILPYNLYVDKSIVELPKIAFNAGSLTDSIKMATNDYLKFTDNQMLNFSLQN